MSIPSKEVAVDNHLAGDVIEQQATDDIQQFVCFKLSDEEYALDINIIREVIHVPSITPVPQMPEFCLGVINSRGNVIPLFDLRKKFNLPDKGFDRNSRILVAAVDNIIVSIVVDEVLDNIKFEASQIDPAPSIKMQIERECINGLGKLEGRMIVILDMIKLHEFIMTEINSSGKAQLQSEQSS
ncbi:MAG: chemotaxis protein CheW [Candidatus Omnitrophica bacterium]|nr:chemotaxis protein CheW [Candidatus Omnitrophota bacterium]